MLRGGKLLKVPMKAGRVTAVAAGRYESLTLVVPRNQTITFDPLANKRYGDPDFSVYATASSGLALPARSKINVVISRGHRR